MSNGLRKTMLSAKSRAAGLALLAGTLCQFGSCQLGQITTSSTLDGRDALIQILRALIITPIETALTNAINEVVPGNGE